VRWLLRVDLQEEEEEEEEEAAAAAAEEEGRDEEREDARVVMKGDFCVLKSLGFLHVLLGDPPSWFLGLIPLLKVGAMHGNARYETTNHESVFSLYESDQCSE
jgi:hypothetical protein